MTEKERKLALYCLKASSDYHSEVCEKCINYPNCDHTMQDDVTETIIKALEQTDGDLISRQAVKDLIRGLTKWSVKSQDRKFENVGLLYDDVMFGIDRLPGAEKTAEWIPVKDRMPEFNDIVLASTDSDYDELRVIITVYKAEEFWFNGKIKAWMPLPEWHGGEK